MNSLRNNVQLIGNAGNAPEVFSFDSGNKKVTLSIATNDSYTNKAGERVTDTQWHRVTAWNKTAQIIEQYVKKGTQVAISGKLSTRSWVDAEGKKQYVTEVTAHEVQLLGAKNNA